jgi:hypothetical protein
VSDKEREAEEAAMWAARQQAQADVASMLGKAYSCVKPGDYNVKCTVTDPGAAAGPGDEFTEGCAHRPIADEYQEWTSTSALCSKCEKKIVRDVGPWREAP